MKYAIMVAGPSRVRARIAHLRASASYSIKWMPHLVSAMEPMELMDAPLWFTRRCVR